MVSGSTLTITYDSELDEVAMPPEDAFTVAVNLLFRDISNVSVTGDKVILTLSSAVESGKGAYVTRSTTSGKLSSGTPMSITHTFPGNSRVCPRRERAVTCTRGWVRPRTRTPHLEEHYQDKMN